MAGGLALLLGACGGLAPAPSATPTASATPSVTATPSDTPTPSATPTPTFPVDALVSIDALNLRAGPDTMHPIQGVAGRSTPVAIRGRDDTGEWFSVLLPDAQEGWLSAAYLQLRRDYESIPTQPTPSPPPSPTVTPIPMDPSLPLIALPPVVAQGDPLLLRLRDESARQVVAAFDGRETPLFEVSPGNFAGILSAGLDTHPGGQPIYLTLIDGDGNSQPRQLDIRIHSGGYPEERIDLSADRQGLLDPSVADAETARLREVWAPVTAEKLWQGPWTWPVSGAVSSLFGTFRNYNEGQLSGRHTGLDLRGPVGTPVLSPARGRVVLAEPLTVRGNCIWLDHGWGVYSGYFHLSEIVVAPGDLVERGAQLGAVGATGRVTAPHLHWELRVLGAPAHPVQFVLRDVGFVP
jgi:hypothetical protein